jgi:hypothetical protein
MDQTSDGYLEFKRELKNMMAETVGEIKPELAEAVEWRTFVQCYPGTCLLAGGTSGWILGRSLRSFQRPASSAHELVPRPSESSMFPRMADKVVSTVLAEALPIIAAKMRRFSDVTTHPAKE